MIFTHRILNSLNEKTVLYSSLGLTCCSQIQSPHIPIWKTMHCPERSRLLRVNKWDWQFVIVYKRFNKTLLGNGRVESDECAWFYFLSDNMKYYRRIRKITNVDRATYKLYCVYIDIDIYWWLRGARMYKNEKMMNNSKNSSSLEGIILLKRKRNRELSRGKKENR